MTGTIVALCSATNDEEASRLHSDSIQPLLRFHGLAFLHSFDVSAQQVVLFTPCPVAELEKVDTLVRGYVQWAPYTTSEKVDENNVENNQNPIQAYRADWTLDRHDVGDHVEVPKHLREGMP